LRVSVGEVLQVSVTPEEDLPLAPAGLQNAPGDTVGSWERVRVGVGEGVGLLVPVETGVGVALEAGPCHIQVATG